jgi:hypothetical protein
MSAIAPGPAVHTSSVADLAVTSSLGATGAAEVAS